MEKYLFTSLNGSRRILFGYDEGMLREISIEGPISDAEIAVLRDNFPWMEIELKHFEIITRGKITRINLDLSFEVFWNAYGYKVGNKDRTEKLWGKLSEVEKAQVLKSIPIYDQFLALKNNQAKTYPETYLSQRRFDNSYKIL